MTKRFASERLGHRPSTGADFLKLTVWLGLILLAGCSKNAKPTAPATPRTYRMGFSAIPPRPDAALIVQTINTWAPHADMALILTEPPWDSLLAGRQPGRQARALGMG